MKARYIVLLCVCIACICVCIAVMFMFPGEPKDVSEDLESKLDSLKQNAAVTDDTPDSENTDTTDAIPDVTTADTTDGITEDTAEVPRETTAAAQTTDAPSDSIQNIQTLDFNVLWETNPEICAWLEIVGTMIDYPILQSVDNDKKYLSTAFDGTPYIGGAIFTEATYNSTDFNDPVTVIYGHTMRSGNLFGQLQKVYSDPSSFKNFSKIKIYLPDEVRIYTVFAAVPYSSIHLLHTYDFSNEYWHNRFFMDVMDIREIGANFNGHITPEFGDRIIILSVCLNSDTTRRYLVMAAHDSDLTDSVNS